MADNIKQIKVEGVSYDLNAKYIQDGAGNPKTWQNITDLINAGVQLVTDNARKEAAGDGAIGAPATTAAAGTMGKIYLVADDGGISGTYVEFVTIDKGPDKTGATGYVQYVWEKIGTTAADLTNYVKKGQISLSGTAATAGATATGSAGAGAASNTGAAGAIDTTVSITDTAGAPTVTGSGGGATVTSAAAGAATITSTSAGAHTHSVTIAAHSHSVTVGAHSHTITPTTNTFTYALKVAAHSHSYTKPTAHTHSIAQHTHSVSVKGNNY